MTKRTPLIPFGFWPGSWGLKGKTREIARAEYELEQRDLEEKLLEINYGDDLDTLALKKLDLRLKFSEIDQYYYDCAVVKLTEPDPEKQEIAMLDINLKHNKISQYDYDMKLVTLTKTDETQQALALLDADFKHEKITQLEYDRKRADILKEPWVSMPVINWDPAVSSRTYFQLDYNDYFYKHLLANGYDGDEDDVINKWLNDVCISITEEINGMEADLITPSRRADPLITPDNDSET